MPPVMDHVADTNHAELARLSKLYELPDFVKKADLAKVTAPRDDTAASTFLSALFFIDKQAEYHAKIRARIEERINYYTGFWKIKAAVDRLAVAHAEYSKEAHADLPDSAFAYVATQSTGKKERHLPMRNAMEVKAAAVHLLTFRDRFPYVRRNEMAQRILEKAATYGAAIGPHREFLEKQAGMGVCNPDHVIAMLRDRARLATVPHFKQEIVKLAEITAKQPQQTLHPQMLVELTKTVEAIDRGLGLIGKYTDKIPWPEDVIFEATYSKAASEVDEACPLTSGAVYNREDFKRLKLADVRSLFGDDVAEEVRSGLNSVDAEKMAEVAATLPRPDAMLLDALMKEAGIRPHLTKTASAPTRTKAEWGKLATSYGS